MLYILLGSIRYVEGLENRLEKIERLLSKVENTYIAPRSLLTRL